MFGKCTKEILDDLQNEVPPSKNALITRKATWKRDFKLPWHEASPHNHHDDAVDSDQ